MRRPWRLLAYVGLILLLGGLIFVVIFPLFGSVGVLVAALLMLIPGRISARSLRDLYLSRHLIDDERYDEAIAAAARFLGTLKSQPWRRWLIFGAYGFYSGSVEALARNNLGVAHMMRGELDDADREFEHARSLDRAYAVPVYNLGLSRHARGDLDAAERLIDMAAEMGFKHSLDDQIASKISAAYARINTGRA